MMEIEKRTMRNREKKPTRTIAIFLALLLVSATIIVCLSFLPIRVVNTSESRDAQSQTGIDTVRLTFLSDVTQVHVAFEDLDDELVTLRMSMKGRTGLLAPSSLYDLSFQTSVDENILTVISELDVATLVWPLSFVGLNVTCDIRIARSMNVSLNLKTSVGGIVMSTRTGVSINSLILETTTGGVEATLAPDVIVSGDISLKSTTGAATLNWNKVMVSQDLLIDVMTITGGVDVNVKQEDMLTHNVTVNAEATTGGVDFTVTIQDTVGAKIESSVTTGGIQVERQVGFAGTGPLLTSNNYPANGNFDVQLQTTTGGITINAKYTP
jgi:hypothetical protein